MNLGYIGLATLIIGYFFLNTKSANYFLIFNAVSCFILLIYSIQIRDIPFIGVNAFAGSLLTIKYFRGGIEHGKTKPRD